MTQNETGAVLRPRAATPAESGALPSHESTRPPSLAPPAASTPKQGVVPAPGTRIHQYELIRQLGSGGMGTVFLARDTRLGRRVAIKFLHATAPEITRRFILEARATARCSHENIVVIHEVGEFQGTPFMVLEYLQGQPLHKAVGGQRLPATRAVELMVPVVRALVAAHEQGIVHRDLKPDNILVTESGTLKVLDFGIAKVLQASERTAELDQRRAPAPRPVGGSGLGDGHRGGARQPDLRRRHPRHAVVHVSRAVGQRRPGGSPDRPLGRGHHAVPDARGETPAGAAAWPSAGRHGVPRRAHAAPA